ncbi:hypothetical protein J7894_00605 [Mycoplasmopsis agalactiae]|nr:hypothetical protein [Mycoplasmopsis agalactiae]MCE6090606.1 hypothetical protein [Mycoplasmopsis agalactiae]
MLGTHEFQLNVNYETNVATVIKKDRSVVLYKFTGYNHNTRPANNTDAIGTGIGELKPYY